MLPRLPLRVWAILYSNLFIFVAFYWIPYCIYLSRYCWKLNSENNSWRFRIYLIYLYNYSGELPPLSERNFFLAHIFFLFLKISQELRPFIVCYDTRFLKESKQSFARLFLEQVLTKPSFFAIPSPLLTANRRRKKSYHCAAIHVLVFPHSTTLTSKIPLLYVWWCPTALIQWSGRTKELHSTILRRSLWND